MNFTEMQTKIEKNQTFIMMKIMRQKFQNFNFLYLNFIKFEHNFAQNFKFDKTFVRFFQPPKCCESQVKSKISITF